MRSVFITRGVSRFASLLRIGLALVGVAFAPCLLADDLPKTPEDLRREAAIAEFTKKMEDANYPALFAQAAAEYKVPVQILEGVSFAETRWEHLQWPAGETVSPDNGMPRPYGIMSLWDNNYFGHTLVDAAKLIGKTPDDLKNDPLDNMRGAAALLRQIYDSNPKPSFASEGDLENWFNAISKFCGIPQPELNSQHAFEVYRHLDEGYGEYGIKMEKVPGLKLAAMAAEVQRIKDEVAAKKQPTLTPEELAGMGTQPGTPGTSATPVPPNIARAIPPAPAPVSISAPAHAPASPPLAAAVSSTDYGLIATLVAGGGFLIFFLNRLKSKPGPNPNRT